MKTILKVTTEHEAEAKIKMLRSIGYKRVENAYWVEIWEKGGHKVQLERDF